MKLVILPQCKIGARTYKIVWWNDKMKYSADAIAQGSGRDQIIRLPKEWSAIANFVHLIHEIGHQADYLSAGDGAERNVRPESEFLAQALLSLGIEPDFSQLQEEEV